MFIFSFFFLWNFIHSSAWLPFECFRSLVNIFFLFSLLSRFSYCSSSFSIRYMVHVNSWSSFTHVCLIAKYTPLILENFSPFLGLFFVFKGKVITKNVKVSFVFLRIIIFHYQITRMYVNKACECVNFYFNELFHGFFHPIFLLLVWLNAYLPHVRWFCFMFPLCF